MDVQPSNRRRVPAAADAALRAAITRLEQATPWSELLRVTVAELTAVAEGRERRP